MAMYGYVGLCSGYVWLCMAVYGYVWLCRAMYVGLCRVGLCKVT